MHSAFRIPDDVSPSLHPLINQFRTDALRIRGVAAETADAELLYICRFFSPSFLSKSVSHCQSTTGLFVALQSRHRFSSVFRGGYARFQSIPNNA